MASDRKEESRAKGKGAGGVPMVSTDFCVVMIQRALTVWIGVEGGKGIMSGLLGQGGGRGGGY